MCKNFVCMLLLGALAWTACENVDTNPDGDRPVSKKIELEDVAKLLSEINIGEAQLGEVYDAVSASTDNGYDEEYMMCDLFTVPGAGVGSAALASKAGFAGADTKGYDRPLRDLIREGLEARAMTKAPMMTVDEYLDALESSDIQIYWPYSEEWDGKTFPVITFDPNDGSETNVGWKMNAEGLLVEVLVDEELARERPVWVINRNDDSGHTTLEMLRKSDPDWGQGGGTIIIGRPENAPRAVPAEEAQNRMLVLRNLTMLRNFDSWFAGASEFVIKMGSASGFRYSTEAELKLFVPTVTDFVVVVRRKMLGQPVEFNAVVISDFTDQIEDCVLLVTEDDGGSQTSWKCSASVKYNSKSYGFELEIPYRQSDDLVWRGTLGRRYLEANNGIPGHFGETDLTFELVWY